MAAAVRTVVVYRLLEVVDVEYGRWCTACALPSAAVITLASQATVAGIEGPLKLSQGLRCLDGHGWIHP
jgi:hypothetical protein